MTMQKLRSGFGLFVCVFALCGGLAMGQTRHLNGEASAKQVDRAFDPDAGTEAPFDAEAFEGEVAGGGDGCETIGGFTSPFTSPNRYRGNLYRITDSGVFL